MKLTRGHEKYRAFLEKHGISKSSAARAIHVTHSAVFGYLDGSSTPGPERRRAIAVWTSGEILEEDWLTEEERESAKLSNVVPFVPPSEGAAE